MRLQGNNGDGMTPQLLLLVFSFFALSSCPVLVPKSEFMRGLTVILNTVFDQ